MPISKISESTKNETRAGFVALIGAPNAGKSTLMNQLVGSKISIVTHKVQTTRAVMRGIAIHENCQIVFVDTPGIFAPRRKLDEAMVSTAWGSARDADVSIFLLDAERGVTDDIEKILGNLDKASGPVLLLLNKIDQVKREELLELTAKLNELYPFKSTFMVSALKGDGCAELMDYLATHLPAGPFMYPEDQISDLPMRMLAAEVTREKLYLRLHQELPYASHVETEAWEEKKDGSVKINQVIYVERQSQKKIVIGKNGTTIKAISTAARKELTELTEQKVHLFLFVKVRENWGDDPDRYREMGLEFPSG
ncbi:MAG: GTPase Era [Rhizobiaceae bacterium]